MYSTTLTGVCNQLFRIIDKGYTDTNQKNEAINKIAATYNKHAITRRINRGSAARPFDQTDLPVADKYIKQIKHITNTISVQSRWLNAVSLTASPNQFQQIAKLDFVKYIKPVNRSLGTSATPKHDNFPMGGDFYGLAETQLDQINLINLHEHGFKGEGIIIGVLDTGFRTTHDAFNHPDQTINVLAAWDFINNDPIVDFESGDDPGQHVHGTLILGTLAAYNPNVFVGAAYEASYVLAKTEDITNEYQQEEDFYVAGLEFIEQNGADVATSSLLYIDWYTQDDLDGLTAVTTIAVNAATEKGMLCCTAAGNNSHDQNPNTSSLGAPADAFQVFTCGAVESTGEIAGFSSDGPTADGRVKPEILAQGVEVFSISPGDNANYVTASGTSLSTPLIAGAIACLTQARPIWTVDQMRTNVLESGDWYKTNGTYDPDYVYGYGVIDAFDAVNALIFSPLTPAIAGEINTLIADGGTPDETIYFIWGTQVGTATVPGCSGLTANVMNPKIAGQAIADPTGHAQLDRFVHSNASGMTVRLQAIETASCRQSNLQQQTIE